MRKFVALVISIAFLSACTTGVTVMTDPSRSRLSVDGIPVTKRTPYKIRRGKSFFATGEVTVTTEAEGYNTEKKVLEQVVDGNCIGQTLAYSVGGALLLVFPILGLVYLPWCSKFEDESVFIELDAIKESPPAVGAGPNP